MIRAAQIQKIRRRWRLLHRLSKKDVGSKQYQAQRDGCDGASEWDVATLLLALAEQKMRTHYWRLVARMRLIAVELLEKQFTQPSPEELRRFNRAKRAVDYYRKRMKAKSVRP